MFFFLKIVQSAKIAFVDVRLGSKYASEMVRR